MSSNDFLSPFEELVLTALADIGHGALHWSIWRKVQKLSGRDRIPLRRVEFTLGRLEKDSCVYSWMNDGEADWMWHYRMQLRGERALQAANRRREPTREYFYRASRFGILWDIWRGVRCRKRAALRRWFEGANGADGHGEYL